jgi:hypothetical protein
MPSAAYNRNSSSRETVINYWQMRARFLRQLVLSAFFVLICYLEFGTLGATFVATAFTAVFLRDFGYLRRNAKVWPVFNDVLDWNKIEQLTRSGD